MLKRALLAGLAPMLVDGDARVFQRLLNDVLPGLRIPPLVMVGCPCPLSCPSRWCPIRSGGTNGQLNFSKTRRLQPVMTVPHPHRGY